MIVERLGRRHPLRHASLLATAVLGGGTLDLAAQRSARDELPPEFEQILPRGNIAAIDAPRFVAATDAQISDDAWVLGLVIDGEARAYSLNLLNRHEVVNDSTTDTAFAAVW